MVIVVYAGIMYHDIGKGLSFPLFHSFPAQCIMALNEITKFEIIANGLDTLIILAYIFSDILLSTTAF
jgi:hypothetical protein